MSSAFPSTPTDPSETADPRPPRRHDIDGLRGIAVLAVVGFHFFPGTFRGGFIGVDVFFVISGFVITQLLATGPAMSRRRLLDFWGKRARRLLPALALVMLTVLVVGWFVLWSGQYSALGQNVGWASAMGGNLYSWMTTRYFGMEPTASPLLNLWSLGVEEQFYLVWPLLFALIIAARRRYVGLIVVGLAAVSWIAGVVHVMWSPSADDALASVFYLPQFRAWELLIGAGIALLVLRGPKSRTVAWLHRVPAWAYVVMVGLLVVSLVLPPWRLAPSVYAVPAVILTAVLIAVATGRPSIHAVMGNRPLLWFGGISYPLYLWHWPVLTIALALGVALSLPTGLALVGASVLLAAVTRRFVEIPVQARPVSRRMILILIATMFSVALLGFVVHRADGFPGRGDALAQELNAFSYEPRADSRTGTCFLEGLAAGHEAVLDPCVVAEPGKRNVLLWGDSHAAHLYGGLLRALPADATLTQLTSSSCQPSTSPPPSGDVACGAVNHLALQGIKDGRYDEIVISSRWNTADEQDLTRTLADLSRMTDARVTVLGPDPEWSPSLPRNWSMFEVQSMVEIPKYSAHGLNQAQFDLNESIRNIVVASGSEYFDVLGVLCRDRECLVRVDETTASLTAWDYGHLTPAGSRLVGAALAADLAEDPTR